MGGELLTQFLEAAGTSAMSKAGGKVIELLTGGFLSDGSSQEGDSQEKVDNFANQGEKMIEQMGENAESPEELLDALDGFEMEISTEEGDASKKFKKSN